MRHSRRCVAFSLAALVGVSSAEDARAQLVIVATPGEPPAVAHAELAYAAGEGTPVTWLSLRVARGPLALVAALPMDAVASAGLDAWFAALEVSASPNVMLPLGSTNCGQVGSFVHVAWPRGVGVAPEELSVQTPDDVAAALDVQGLHLDGELPAAKRYLIWSWPAANAAQTTRTLRIAGGERPLSLLPGSPFPILVSSVTRGSSGLPTELFNRELQVTFVAQERPASDYRQRLQDWLVARTEPLLEARGRGPLFDWTIHDDSISRASLVSSYAMRAAKQLPEIDGEACATQLRALREPQAASAAACGAAADASLALLAAGSELPTLQRFVVSGASGFSPADAGATGMPSPPLLRAQLLDASACDAEARPLPMVPPRDTPVGNNPGPRGGTTTVVVEQTVVVDDAGTSDVSCGGSPQPEPDDSDYVGSEDGCAADTSTSSEADSSDSCSGDSSSSTDSNTDSCSGDSSSSTDSNADSCSGDSSSSTDSNADSCSGDSSTDSGSDSGCASDSTSSDSSDSGCDGGSDESSGYDGDTCTGAAAPERSEKSQAGLSSRPNRQRPRRLKTSLWSVAFAAFILPIRRRKRSRCASG